MKARAVTEADGVFVARTIDSGRHLVAICIEKGTLTCIVKLAPDEAIGLASEIIQRANGAADDSSKAKGGE